MPDESMYGNGGSNPSVKVHWRDGLTVNKSGYLYIYVSNETPNIAVFFDNLQVTHMRGPLVEETHYYPWGLNMSAISSKAFNFGQPENKIKFNGAELNDVFDINIYELLFRNYDHQIGRWFQPDPKPADFESLFAAMSNNPISKNDILGDTARFYNSQGQVIGERSDGSKTITPTIISDDNLDAFNSVYNSGRKHYDNDKDYLKAMQKMGTVYDTKAFSKFFDENIGKFKAEYIVDYSLKDATEVKVDGKPVNKNSLTAEAVANTVLEGNVVAVGNNPATSNNSMTGANPDKPGNEPGQSGKIHLHPTSKTMRVEVKSTFTVKVFTLEGGAPSPGDYSEFNRNGKGTRHVMVDSKNIYLYNGNSSQTIIIPKR